MPSTSSRREPRSAIVAVSAIIVVAVSAVIVVAVSAVIVVAVFDIIVAAVVFVFVVVLFLLHFLYYFFCFASTLLYYINHMSVSAFIFLCYSKVVVIIRNSIP